MMKTLVKRLYVLVTLAVLVSVSPARAEIAVENVGGAVRSLAQASATEINDFFAGYTFKFNSRITTRSYPWHGPSFLYFAPNGSVAVWTHRERQILGGRWETGPFGNSDVLLCFDFDGWNEGGACVVLESARTLVQQRTPGNVFSLKAGAAAPMVLRRNQVDFKFVANELGL
jgi:hypothetical protein